VQHYDGTCTDIIGAGGQKNLTAKQKRQIQSWPIEDKVTMPGVHAEVTVLEAKKGGFESLPFIYEKPIAIGTSKPFCPSCRQYLTSYVRKPSNVPMPATLVAANAAKWDVR
jgi:hypothetical protein